MRIGLFGGTFNPVHIGHVALAQCALTDLALDTLIWIPAIPWQKPNDPMMDAALRVKLIKASIAKEPKMRVDTIEVDRGGASYSVDTLSDFRARYPTADIFYLIGADQWQNFETWRDWQRVLELAHIVVVARNGKGLETTPAVADFVCTHPGCVTKLEMPAVNVSSSAIRNIITREGINSPNLFSIIPKEARKILEEVDHRLF